MENTTQTQSDSGLFPSTKITLYAILLAWSLTGNVLVIAVVFANTTLRTRFNYLIVNMAFSDLVIPLLVMPLSIVQEARERPSEWLIGGSFGTALCKLCYFLSDISPGISMLSLLVIAVNRFIAIAYPLRVQTSRKRSIMWLVAFTWIVSMVLFSPYLYIFKVVSGPGYLLCLADWKPHFEPLISYTIHHSICIILLFIVPFFIISVLYTILIYKIYKKSKGMQDMLNDQQARSRERRNKHIFYISIAVVLAFALFWGPFFCLYFTVVFIWQYQIPPHVQLHWPKIVFIVNFLGYMNSALNPCMYFVLMKNFRQGLKKLFQRNSGNARPPETSIYLNSVSSKLLSTRQNLKNVDSKL